MPSGPKRPAATLEEALARPDDERVELIRGTLVHKAAPKPFDAVETAVDELFGADSD